MVCEVNTPILDGPRRAFLELELYRQTVEARDFIVLVEELEKLKEEIARLNSRPQIPPVQSIKPELKLQLKHSLRISDVLRIAKIDPVVHSFQVV